MKPWLRKFTLLMHVTFSVAWLGAVAAYLLLAGRRLQATEPAAVQGTYVALELIGWYVIVPLCSVGVVAGVVQSLTTEWGLFRHYWIAAKLVLSALATGVLLTHMRTVSGVAALARDGALLGPQHAQLKLQLVVHAALGLLVLLAIMVLSVYKPWGKLAFRRPPRKAPSPGARLVARPALGPDWRRYFLGSAVAVALVHLAVHGLRSH